MLIRSFFFESYQSNVLLNKGIIITRGDRIKNRVKRYLEYEKLLEQGVYDVTASSNQLFAPGLRSGRAQLYYNS